VRRSGRRARPKRDPLSWSAKALLPEPRSTVWRRGFRPAVNLK
jgi:hypothetical protein